jgi:hypothetical protein
MNADQTCKGTDAYLGSIRGAMSPLQGEESFFNLDPGAALALLAYPWLFYFTPSA